jgi:hypothetical protein
MLTPALAHIQGTRAITGARTALSLYLGSQAG